MKRACALLIGVLSALLVIPLSAADAGERELTSRCVFTLPEDSAGNGAARLTDGSVMTRVRIPGRQSLTVELPGGATGVYLSWYEAPESASITLLDDGGGILSTHTSVGLLNEWLPLPSGVSSMEIAAGRQATLSDVRVFNVSAAPGWLPLANPVPAKTDLLLVAAHAGDEQLDLGGVLPLYAGQRGLRCTVVFCSHRNRQALQDSLYALQISGVSTEPVYLNLPDRTYYSAPEDQLKKIWKEPEAVAALARVIRQYRPEALVAHSPEGEGDEGVKRLASRTAQRAVEKAADPAFEPNAANGPWQVKKLYLHAAGPSAVRLPMDAPIANLGGRSPAELATAGYAAYTFARVYRRTAAPDGVFSLLASTVGPDTEANDLMEHIPAGALTTGGAGDAPHTAPATPTPVPSPTPAPAVPGVPAPSATPWAEYFRQSGEPPETVIADYEKGYYEYRSDELSVRIDTRHTGKPAAYHVAHIRMRDVDAFRPGFGHPREGGMTKQSAEGMARRYKAVLLITGDDLTHMEVEEKGILLRNGRYYSAMKGEATMALYPGMDMKIFFPNDVTYRALLDQGVENTYSFGPVLVYDGKVYKYAYQHRNRQRNPRVGVGMVAPGHFVAIAADGRIPGYSVGLEIMEFAKLFLDEGCQVAYNLDGGASEAMVFMGEYVSLRAEAHVRTMPDALMWGYSELVPGLDAPYVHSGVYKK